MNKKRARQIGVIIGVLFSIMFIMSMAIVSVSAQEAGTTTTTTADNSTDTTATEDGGSGSADNQQGDSAAYNKNIHMRVVQVDDPEVHKHQVGRDVHIAKEQVVSDNKMVLILVSDKAKTVSVAAGHTEHRDETYNIQLDKGANKVIVTGDINGWFAVVDGHETYKDDLDGGGFQLPDFLTQLSVGMVGMIVLLVSIPAVTIAAIHHKISTEKELRDIKHIDAQFIIDALL